MIQTNGPAKNLIKTIKTNEMTKAINETIPRTALISYKS